jgi:hypothetical protein
MGEEYAHELVQKLLSGDMAGLDPSMLQYANPAALYQNALL